MKFAYEEKFSSVINKDVKSLTEHKRKFSSSTGAINFDNFYSTQPNLYKIAGELVKPPTTNSSPLCMNSYIKY